MSNPASLYVRVALRPINTTKSSDLLDIMACTIDAVRTGLIRDLARMLIYLKIHCLRLMKHELTFFASRTMDKSAHLLHLRATGSAFLRPLAHVFPLCRGRRVPGCKNRRKT